MMRGLLELLGLAPAPTIPVDRIEAVRILPGDAVVIFCDYSLSSEVATRVRHEVEEFFRGQKGLDGVRVLVLTKGIELGVLRAEGEDPAPTGHCPEPEPPSADLDPGISV